MTRPAHANQKNPADVAPSPTVPQLTLHVPFMFAILLAVAGAFLPSYCTWGVSYWSLFPLWALGAAVLVYLIVGLPPVSGAITQAGESVGSRLQKLPAGIRLALFGVIALALFLAFRSQTMLYGDGWMWVNLSSEPGVGQLLDDYGRLKPLTFLIYRLGYLVFSSSLGGSDLLAFGITSATGGVVACFGLYRLAGVLSKTRAEQIFLFVWTLTGGCTVLFFGYIESYVWNTAGFIWLLYFAVTKALGRGSWMNIILAGLLMSLCYVVMVPAFLAVFGLLATHQKSRDGHSRYLFGWTFGRLVIVVTVLATVTVVALRLLLPQAAGFILHPLAGQTYWAFSGRHLTDMANQIALVAPLLPGMVIIGLAVGRVKSLDRPELHLILASVLVMFSFAFWVDPELGAPRGGSLE